MLGESADLVGEFVLSQLCDDGGFADREGSSDLYYTVFGLNCLQALQIEIPRERIAAYLESLGDGVDLDLVHLTCLARAWAALGEGPEEETRCHLLERLAAFDARTVTDYFLVYGAYQDLAAEPPRSKASSPF